MKLMDEKGRLFGRINVIDLLVILLVIAAVGALAWKFAGKQAAAAVADPHTDLTFTVVFEDTQPDVCAFAHTQLNKQILNDSRLQDATITDVRTQPSSGTEGHEDLFMTVRGSATYKAGAYKLVSQEIRVGCEYILKTSEFEMTGIICSMEASDG